MAIHRQAVVQMVTGLFHDPAMVFFIGLITVVAGVAMVLAHNVWSGGALPVIVTLFSWITLLKGLSLMFLFPCAELASGMGILYQSPVCFYLSMTLIFLLGIYLTYKGFASRTSS
jgi:hypothetical protein